MRLVIYFKEKIMSYKIRSKEKNNLEVEIVISEKKWEESLQKAYEETKNKYSVQGFRKGKAPRKVIEKQYGESVFFDYALEIAFADEYNEFLDKNLEIEPIAQPDVRIEKFEKSGIVLVASAPLMPEVKEERKRLRRRMSKQSLKPLQKGRQGLLNQQSRQSLATLQQLTLPEALTEKFLKAERPRAIA